MNKYTQKSMLRGVSGIFKNSASNSSSDKIIKNSRFMSFEKKGLKNAYEKNVKMSGFQLIRVTFSLKKYIFGLKRIP